MAWLKPRNKQDGTVQYTGMYRDLKGRERSAGTSASKREALRKAVAAESQAQAGRVGDPKRGRQTLRHYVQTEWLPSHVMEDSTRESYTYVIERHILGPLGRTRMVDLMPWHIRDWIAELANQGVRAPTIRSAKVCLDAILSTAFHDQVTFLHAGKGVKTPAVARKPVKIITAEQYQRIHDALDDPAMQLLVETAIETGLRWGEVTELRPQDVDLAAGVITVSRAVVHLKAAAHEGSRFKVKDYPKDAEWRRISIAPHLVTKLHAHVEAGSLGLDDLLFPLPHRDGPRTRRRPEVLPDPATLGMTVPNLQGRSYRHGTLTGYQAAKCRCQHCKNAMADYRARRRATGEDDPRPPRTTSTDDDGHLSNDWFRHHIWNPALARAELGFKVTPHGLRHAHASWLLAGGADLQTVKDRLGHGSITTTERYLHSLPDAGKIALAALDTIRAAAPPRTLPKGYATDHEPGPSPRGPEEQLGPELDPDTIRAVLTTLLTNVLNLPQPPG